MTPTNEALARELADLRRERARERRTTRLVTMAAAIVGVTLAVAVWSGAEAGQITYADKNAGDAVLAADFNDIKAAVNDNDTRISGLNARVTANEIALASGLEFVESISASTVNLALTGADQAVASVSLPSAGTWRCEYRAFMWNFDDQTLSFSADALLSTSQFDATGNREGSRSILRSGPDLSGAEPVTLNGFAYFPGASMGQDIYLKVAGQTGVSYKNSYLACMRLGG